MQLLKVDLVAVINFDAIRNFNATSWGVIEVAPDKMVDMTDLLVIDLHNTGRIDGR